MKSMVPGNPVENAHDPTLLGDAEYAVTIEAVRRHIG